jgi:hypothetical protein
MHHMEALIVIAAALMIIVLLDAGYRIALCLVSWAPSLLLGLLFAWFAYCHGVKALEAVAISALTTLVAKRVLFPRFFSDEEHRS